MPELICKTCGKTFHRPPSQVGAYCSMSCYKSDVVPVEERFWRFVNKGESCWEWTGAVATDGYGRIRRTYPSKLNVIAHRLSYQIHFGDIPDGLFVCHHCDNRLCVRPDHLFLGTQLDNVTDMISKGRANWRKPPGSQRGDRNPGAKLSTATVLAIRREYVPRKVTMVMLAERYGVSRTTVLAALHRKNWKHV